jgi:putative heme-binding domain-containing protein
MFRCLSVIFFLPFLQALHAAPLLPADRVVLLGDALFETERHTGALEWELNRRFPDTDLTLHNLSWSGDTPAGLSRASFDPAKAGLERLREHLALAQPTVVILGYGMAASLQELTDRSRDWTLNADPDRYGTMSVARFSEEMETLLKVIADVSGGKARVILVSPIPHEDLRPTTRPNSPDPAPHNAILRSYTEALKTIATTHQTGWVESATLPYKEPRTTDGIHLSISGYQAYAAQLCDALGWKPGPNDPPAALRDAILRKSDAFFHRFRPANATYLFGFRKREQGRNAVEMAEWDKLIADADARILAIKHGTPLPSPASIPSPDREPPPALAKPDFSIPDGYQIDLWAEAPLVRKPLAISWDGAGRLWAASTPIYPQIQPGKSPDDKVYILADTDHNGRADDSVIFADDLLIPTGMAPVATAPGEAAHACYVGASTELLLLTDTDKDGKADTRRVVFSGFGTEDTHHNIHTLRWGPDGRLYFNQSIYTHSHLETPWGLIRLNSGGVFAYDPDSDRVEVFSQGLWNPWGHVWNRDGQSFLSDGAGSSGLAWAFPGAVFNPFEGSQRQMPTVSPGNYPKYAGLELIDSPLFPADWQGTAVTCDFRAHKIVRFAIEDFDKATPRKSGYITRELKPLVVTNDLAFRPIDVKTGPDGALYVADWTNPIINHGEVDFRDPRRDQSNGRIWRISRTGAPAVKRTPTPIAVARSTDPEKDTASDSPRRRIEAMRALARTPDTRTATLILETATACPPDDPYYEFAAWRSIREIGPAWIAAVKSGTWSLPTEEPGSPRIAQADLALRSLPAPLASEALSALMEKSSPALDGSGPWLEWIGERGTAADVQRLFDRLPALKDPALRARGLRSLLTAAKRNLRPANLGTLEPAFFSPATPESLALVGSWKLDFVDLLLANVNGSGALSNAAFEALATLRSERAIEALKNLLKSRELALRRQSLTTLAGFRPDLALGGLPAIAAEAGADPAFWRPLFAQGPFLKQFTQTLPDGCDPAIYAAALTAARECGRAGSALVKALVPLAKMESPATPATGRSVQDILAILQTGGDPARGELIYRRPELTCTLCHAIGGVGGKLGPDLTSIGASAPIDYIIASTLHPERKVKEGYHAVIYQMTDGDPVVGIPSRTTSTEQFIRTITGEQAIDKSAIRSQEIMGTGGSLMPGGLTNHLERLEVRALFSFLQQLGKPGPFDASKGDVARLWSIHPATDPSLATSPKATPGGTPLATLVDGRLPADVLKTALASLPTAYLQTQFVTTGDAPSNLKLEGIREAWVDGEALPVASEPGRKLHLKPGTHVLTIRLTTADLPPHLRATCPDARFLTNPE